MISRKFDYTGAPSLLKKSLKHRFVVLKDVIEKFILEHLEDAGMKNQLPCQNLSVEGIDTYVKILVTSPMIVSILVSSYLHQFVLEAEMFFDIFQKSFQDTQLIIMIVYTGIVQKDELHCV